MRELKFRAYDTIKKKMIYFDFGNIYGYEGEVCGVILPDCYTVLKYDANGPYRGINKDLEIMQFTGLLDKNGREIYESDLVITEQLEDRPDSDKWDRYDWGIAKVYITPENGVTMKTLNGDIWNWADEECVMHLRFIEVIGNIYTNPELLSEPISPTVAE